MPYVLFFVQVSDDEALPVTLSNAPLAIEHIPSHTEQGCSEDCSQKKEAQPSHVPTETLPTSQPPALTPSAEGPPQQFLDEKNEPYVSPAHNMNTHTDQTPSQSPAALPEPLPTTEHHAPSPAIEHVPSHTEQQDLRLQGFGVDLSQSLAQPTYTHHNDYRTGPLSSDHQSTEPAPPLPGSNEPHLESVYTPQTLDDDYQEDTGGSHDHVLQSQTSLHSVSTLTTSSRSSVVSESAQLPTQTVPEPQASPPPSVSEYDSVSVDPAQADSTEEPTGGGMLQEVESGGGENSTEESYEVC